MSRGICDLCERFFETEKVDDTYCPACNQKLDGYFQRIRGYLERHRNASVADVAVETKIPLKMIDRLLKEGRIHVVEDGPSAEERELEWVFKRK